MKTEERSRHTVWMEDTVWQRVQEQYKQDGCSTQNEFIAKAILFYCGYLQSEYAGDFLPKILGETLEAIPVCLVTASANCFSSRLLSKMSVIISLHRTQILMRQHTRKCAA